MFLFPLSKLEYQGGKQTDPKTASDDYFSEVTCEGHFYRDSEAAICNNNNNNKHKG